MASASATPGDREASRVAVTWRSGEVGEDDEEEGEA
jgi:hypothetical protein